MGNEYKTQVAIEVIKQGTGGSQAEQELKNLEAQANKTAASGTSLAASWKGFATAMAAIVGAGLIKNALREFEESERAVKALDGALIATGQHTQAYSAELRTLASAMGDMAKVEDDVVVQAEATLVQFGAMREEMPRLVKGILDMSAAGYDLQTVTRGLGAAVSGEFDPMRRLLKIDFAEGATRAEKLEQILGTLEHRFSGLAASQGKMTGGLNEARLAIKNAEEAIGKFIATGIDGYVRAVLKAGEATSYWQESLTALITGTKTAQNAFNEQQQLLADRLRHLILIKQQSGEMSADDAAALAKEIAGVRNAADAYKQLSDIRQRLLGFKKEEEAATPAANPDRLLDPDLARQEMSDLALRANLYSKWNFTAKTVPNMGTDWMPPKVTSGLQNIREQSDLFKQMLETQLDRGIIKIEEYSAALAELRTKMRIAMTDTARAGSEEADRAFASTLSARERETLGIIQEYTRRKELITDYYEWEKEIAGTTAEGEMLIEKNKTAAIEALTKELDQRLDLQRQMMIEIGTFAANQFASGMSRAFVDFVSGTKDAKTAFSEFASSFMQSVAQMILQLLILRAIKGAFGGALGLAEGGVIMAASGVAGVREVTSATYFPKFNTVAGEAGREALTVLASPRTVNLGGIPAIIGNAGPARLAMLDAGHLAALAGARRAAEGVVTGGGIYLGGGGVGGAATINIRLAAGLRAEIVDDAISGAQLRILNDLGEDSPISSGVKRLTA